MNSKETAPSPAMDWYADRYQSLFVSRNRWLVVGVLSLGVCLTQAAALLCVIPLKTTVPYLVKEETSGAVTTLTQLTGQAQVTYSEAVRKYFLGKYLVARETYDPVDLLESYRQVELMNDSHENQAFHQAIVSNNPASPLVLYGDQIKRYVRIKSISFLNDKTAQLRFTALERRASTPDKPSEWIATVGFGFAAASSAESDRLVNPLGFVVSSYRIDRRSFYE